MYRLPYTSSAPVKTRLRGWRPSVLQEATTVNIASNYGQQGSAHDFRGRVQNLNAPTVKYYRNPWVPQYNDMDPFTVPQRIPNPSPGVRKMTPQRGYQRTAGPLVFSPAGLASINVAGY